MNGNNPHPKISRRTVERVLYILAVLMLVLYGLLQDSEVATRLMEALTNAFYILIQNPS